MRGRFFVVACGPHAAGVLQTTLKISQRLFWNMLRGCNANRVHAACYVNQLQTLLGYSIGVANTLTEIFTDNDVRDARNFAYRSGPNPHQCP